MNTGQKIKAIRLRLGLDQPQFAEKVVPQAKSSNVSRWKNGINTPNAQRLKSIAYLGDVSVDFLLNSDEKYCQITKAELNFVLKSLATMLRQGMLTDEEFDMYLDIENRFKNEVQQDEN